MSKVDHIKYKSGGDYAGAEELIHKEWSYLEQNRDTFKSSNIKGLALSGGGIRSASFNLGVLQALASQSKLEKFDYLSTVSGGGYLGGALSWLWSGLWRKKDQKEPAFGVKADDFPFGTTGRKFAGSEQEKDSNRQHASLLRHLRQHGKYLTPGNGITALSLFSIIFRGIVMGFITLMVMATFSFSLLYSLELLSTEQGTSQRLIFLAFLSLLAYIIVHVLYMVSIARNKYSHDSDSSYRTRRRFEALLPVFLPWVFILISIAAVHWFVIKLDELESLPHIGGISAAIGALLGSIYKESKSEKILKFIPNKAKPVVGLIFMVFGIYVLSDYIVFKLITSTGDLHIAYTGVAFLVLLGLARFLPINNISIHRYYRDRLMETFMPDVDKVLAGKPAIEAMKANATGIDKLGLGENNQAPYHLINTNVILVESKIAKFRGRGGDNFILSPLYCGSNATGWRSSTEFCNGGITLPSAVAISGAAANPNSGVAGKGLTTNPVISILMSIFNLRLGYWASNPDDGYQPDQGKVPSYLKPGFWEVLFRNKMNEEASFVQLSDGGHFENLGLYELFRRRAKFIVVSDAGADPDYQFGDLANAIEKARVDFGISVNIGKEELSDLIPSTKPGQMEMDYPVAEKGFVVAEIEYPDQDESKAILVYIKTTLAKNIGADIHGYKRVHPDFPDQTTADQFFDEVQFEAYRELGWQIARDMLEDDEVMKVLK